MKGKDLRRELEGGRIRPAYLVAGEEALLRDEALEVLVDAVLAGAARDFNLQRLRAPEIRAGELLDSLQTLPVMAERRLVVLADPDRVRGSAASAVGDAIVQALESLEEGGSGVLVVVCAKPDGRSRWVKRFREPAVRIECDAPRDARSLAAFLREEARRQQVDLDPEAAGLLAERIGPQLLLLRQELAKAQLVAGPGRRVERHHVEVSTSLVAEQPVWDLTDAIGEGRADEALVLLARLLSQGTALPPLLGVLASHFRKLLRARAGGKVPGPPFAVRKIERQAARYTPARLERSLQLIHRTDLALKGAGSLSPKLALERLVLALAG